MAKVECKICGNISDKIFTKKILGKYQVGYNQCIGCHFLQTDKPYWLEEAYRDGAIGALDVGIMYRNKFLVEETSRILNTLFDDFTEFKALDFGGGYGVFVRCMRDKGFNFYRQDLYAENLFAKFFDIDDLEDETKFDLLTAFEVFEHLENPFVEIRNMLKYSDILLFSTELQPSTNPVELKNWWYLAEEGGQHVSFYSKQSLMELAHKFGVNFYSNSKNLHIFSQKELLLNPFESEKQHAKIRKNVFKRLILKLNQVNRLGNNFRDDKRLESLIDRDFNYIKHKISNCEN